MVTIGAPRSLCPQLDSLYTVTQLLTMPPPPSPASFVPREEFEYNCMSPISSFLDCGHHSQLTQFRYKAASDQFPKSAVPTLALQRMI